MVLQAEGDGIDHGLSGGAAAFSTRIEHGWVGTPGEDRARMVPERTAQQSASAFRIGEGRLSGGLGFEWQSRGGSADDMGSQSSATLFFQEGGETQADQSGV